MKADNMGYPVSPSVCLFNERKIHGTIIEI
jgi:hypothetical protein